MLSDKAKLRRKIIRQLRKIIRDCEQTINDAEYWNGLPHNQKHTPIDVEHFRVNRAWAVKQLKQFETGACP